MINWIFAIFIIFDVIYQMFGNSKSIEWGLFYDLYHYITLSLIALYFVFNSKLKLVLAFSSYLISVIILIIINYIVRDNQELKMLDNSNYHFLWSVAILTLLTFFLWENLKKIGK